MLEGVWIEEAAKWCPDLHWAYGPYSGLCDSEKGPRGGRKTLPRLRPEFGSFYHADTLIFDEAHYLKGRNTNWTRAALQLVGRADTVWQASGTPIPNWAQELFIPAQILHPGDRDFTAYWRWAKRWFDIWFVHGGRKVAGLRKDRTWEQFHEFNLGDAFLQRTWDELEDQLPPLRHQTIEVDMTPRQRRFYTSLKKDYVAELDGERHVAWNDGSKASLLVKSSFGLEAIDPRTTGGSGKLRMAEELLRSWEGHPAVVVAHHRSVAHLAGKLCEKVGRDPVVVTGEIPPGQRFDLAHRFQHGQGDTLCCTIESIAEGLTLTRADRMLFLEKSYRPSRNRQVERRIWRISQENPVLVVDLVTRQSVDQRVRTALETKTDQQVRALSPKAFAALL
jgi:SNF2 family DNA or RNA helicase